ncbi:O-antigen/teichoic acid export membrane protein [Paracoccus lutimaris]|uniref:O-antigen/teichoic acid export membrane protein n=2 Tax=Paracoccus lutimaris TaxID=1490030 RepID=A0A368YK05_9RHOB|nr:O-antigen/teichoic acid export membrane protein [Paracoccus lutimaris]
MAGEHAAGLIDSLLLIGARVGTNLLVLAWTVLMVRLMTPDMSGIAFAGIAVAQIASMFLTLNVEAVSMRVLVPAMRDGRLEVAAGFIRFNRRILLLALPPVALAAWLWQSLQSGPGSVMLTLSVTAAMVMAAMARITGRHATALGVMRKGILPRMLTGPVVLTCGLGLAALAGLRLQPWHVVALYALSEALTVVIQNRLLRDSFAPFAGLRGDSSAGREWIVLGLWLAPGALMIEFRKAVLIAAAGLALTPADVSLFAVALSIINIMNFGVSAVDVAFSQRLSRALTGGEILARDRFLAVSGAIKLAGFALGMALVGCFGYWALGWFGTGYQAAWPALLILTLIPGLTILFGPGSVILSTCGLGREDFAANMIGAVVTLLAVAGGSALGGLAGAALGSVAGCTAGQALMALYSYKRLGIDVTLTSLRHLRHEPGKAGVAA